MAGQRLKGKFQQDRLNLSSTEGQTLLPVPLTLRKLLVECDDVLRGRAELSPFAQDTEGQAAAFYRVCGVP